MVLLKLKKRINDRWSLIKNYYHSNAQQWNVTTNRFFTILNSISSHFFIAYCILQVSIMYHKMNINDNQHWWHYSSMFSFYGIIKCTFCTYEHRVPYHKYDFSENILQNTFCPILPNIFYPILPDIFRPSLPNIFCIFTADRFLLIVDRATSSRYKRHFYWNSISDVNEKLLLIQKMKTIVTHPKTYISELGIFLLKNHAFNDSDNYNDNCRCKDF